jgi:hypothetical protein
MYTLSQVTGTMTSKPQDRIALSLYNEVVSAFRDSIRQVILPKFGYTINLFLIEHPCPGGYVIYLNTICFHCCEDHNSLPIIPG